MKELGLMRHAKSDWSEGGSDDHSRPLAKRGVKSARRMAEFFESIGFTVDSIYCSTAARAEGTVRILVETAGWHCPVVLSDGLYAADVEGLLEMVKRLDERYARALLVGHNPAMEMACSRLVGGGGFRFTTAAIAWLKFDVEFWRQCSAGKGRLEWMVVPRLLGLD